MSIFITKNTEKIIPMIDWYKRQKFKNIGRPYGKVFEGEKMSTNKIYYYKSASKKLGFNRLLSGHSGRYSTLLRLFLANVNETNINIIMHWESDSKMLFKYRGILLENSNIAAPYLLEIHDQKQNNGEGFEF